MTQGEGTPALLARCEDREQLWDWVRAHLGISVPRRGLCENHSPPFEYLASAYFEPADDLLVWGPRGGGKTRLLAVATLLDLLHKPGITVRILGGSLEQAMCTWNHLLPDLERLDEGEDGTVLASVRNKEPPKVKLASGSSCAVLTQSQTSVRGQRVQKMRCDEVELFDRDVWQAASATTRSLELPGWGRVAGTVEALSTHHDSTGLMGELIARSEDKRSPRMIKWCILDVIAPCTRPAEACGSCELFEECRGRARETLPDGSPRVDGFFPIEDIIAIKRRMSRETWESEMLCTRPVRRGRVFPHFSVEEHVAEFDPGQVLAGEAELAIDFGFKNPFVGLFLGRGRDGRVYVFDEYVCSERTTEENVRALRRMPWRATRAACDPAGGNRNEQTGKSAVDVMRAQGFTVHKRRNGIVEGLERVRALIRPAAGPHRLVIHPRCTTLIRCLREYRYKDGSTSELPHKDGEHDHAIDALRYWLANEPGALAAGGKGY